jgi:ferredoxin-NADP reductase
MNPLKMEYQTEFLDRIVRTPAAVSARFKRPAELHFTAGQYMLVDLGNDLVHPLTISSCPEETGFIEFTKRMSNSPFCLRMETVEKGETIRVKGPMGKFICDDSDETLVMIAGGIGITPIWSILQSLVKKKDNSRKVIVIYGNLNREDIAFREELENLKLPDYRLIHVLSDTTGVIKAYKGFITADIIAKEVPNNGSARYMISGPPAMVKEILKALATVNVAKDRILTDIFLGYE